MAESKGSARSRDFVLHENAVKMIEQWAENRSDVDMKDFCQKELAEATWLMIYGLQPDVSRVVMPAIVISE